MNFYANRFPTSKTIQDVSYSSNQSQREIGEENILLSDDNASIFALKDDTSR